MMKRLACIFSTVALTISVVSCATVPPEAIQLSAVVNNRTAAIQTSHEKFISEYFKLSRQRVEDYIRNKFTPQFMGNFTRNARLMEKLTDSSINDAERGEIIIDFAEAAIIEIEKHRNEIISPLRTQETKALESVRASYADLQMMNASISGLLQSVSDVQAEHDALLTKLKLLEDRDNAIDKAVSINDKVLAVIDKGEGVSATLAKIKCTVNESCEE